MYDLNGTCFCYEPEFSLRNAAGTNMTLSNFL